LRELRKDRNWTQEELAIELDVSRQTINAIENEKYNASLELALKISETFQKPVKKIFQHNND